MEPGRAGPGAPRSCVAPTAPVPTPATPRRAALARMLTSDAQVGVVLDGQRYLGVLTLSKIGKMIRSDA